MPREWFDVAVVGGGAAGCVVARRLAESGDRTVILLEGGPDLRSAIDPDWRDGWTLPVIPDWGFESEADGNVAGTKLRRGRLVGGTSWLTRFAVRGAAADFDAWAARGNPGWSYADVLPTFRAIEADAEFGDLPWHGDHGPIPITRYPALPPSKLQQAALAAFEAMGFPRVEDHNNPDAMGVGRLPMSSRDGVRVTSADAYLPMDHALTNLSTRADALVAAVVVEAGRAVAVRLADGTQIKAGWIILAAGTYGSPSILMRSGIGPAAELAAAGIDPLVDLPGVGRNLADHPAIELDSGARGSATAPARLHSIATSRSSQAPSEGAPDLMCWISDPTADDPTLWLDPILLKPRSRGSVRLHSSDPAAAPRIRLPGLSEPADLERLAEGYRLGVELANRPEIRKLADGDPPTAPRTANELRRHLLENAYSIPHVVGTCRMGPSPDDGDVVDALGRVHGVERLSVIDASVIPEPPSGFPHLITIMLAEHLCERLPGLV